MGRSRYVLSSLWLYCLLSSVISYEFNINVIMIIDINIQSLLDVTE